MIARFLALLATTLVAAPTSASPSHVPDDDALAARGAGVSVTVSEVDDLLLARHGMSKDGRAILDLLVKTRVLEALAVEAKIVVSDADVAELWAKLDRAHKAAGNERGLAAEIERRGVSPEEFKEFLRSALVQERLTREALGIPEDAEVGADQQEIWLQSELGERGLERPAPPWPDGVVARCGNVEIGTEEFGEFLRLRLPRENAQEASWHLLLLAAIEKRMPDVSEEAVAIEVDAEIARRRAQSRIDYPGISYEQRLGAAGRTIEQLRTDPAVLIAALTRIRIDQTYGEEGLRKAYEAERAVFEGRFGRAAKAYMLFLVAGKFVNELNPRTFEQAEAELRDWRKRMGSVEDFMAIARTKSEEPSTRETGGELGWVTEANPKVPSDIREAIFEFLRTGGEVPAGGTALEPVRMPTGSALIWISEVRDSPSWEVMSEHVHEELRRRFVIDVMPTGAMEMLLFKENETK